MSRRRMMGKRKLVFFQQRFYPAGTYNWTVPEGCTSVDVFLVGGGGGSYNQVGGSGGGGGYTKTYKKAITGWRDGDAISVTPGQKINIVVGAGGKGSNRENGGYSQFLNSNYRANGGHLNNQSTYTGGDGGSGGGPDDGEGGSNAGGSDGNNGSSHPSFYGKEGKGQGHTTCDFGESNGRRNAGGGGGSRGTGGGGVSDYSEGSGGNNFGGGGYGGGAGGGWPGQPGGNRAADGGDGTVLIRGYKYE